MVLEEFSRLNLELLAPVEIRNVPQDNRSFQTQPVRRYVSLPRCTYGLSIIRKGRFV